MTDRDERTNGPDSAGGEDAARDRPRAGAAAAARARRIGGRVAGAHPTADQPPARAAESGPSETAGRSDTTASDSHGDQRISERGREVPPSLRNSAADRADRPDGKVFDAASGLYLPPGTELASVGRRIGAYLLSILLAIVTLGIGYIIWGLIAWSRGTTPALGLLRMRCYQPGADRVPGFWRMALREIVGGLVEGILGLVTAVISLVLFLTGAKRQSLHDLVAETVVLYDPNGVLLNADEGGPAGVDLRKPDGDQARPETVPAWATWLPAMVLGAGALVMAILLVVFSHGVWWGATPPGKPSAQQVNAARDQVLAAAKSCVATSNTYKYTDIAGYESKALACTTGKVKSQVETTIQTSIKSLAPELKHSQTCQINTAGIEKVSSDGTWTLLVFGQLESTDTNNPQGVTDPFAAQVQMQQVHGKWLMSGLSEISSQA